MSSPSSAIDSALVLLSQTSGAVDLWSTSSTKFTECVSGLSRDFRSLCVCYAIVDGILRFRFLDRAIRIPRVIDEAAS